MKKLILSTLLLVLPLLASAYDFSSLNADGKTIFYNLINNDTELEVTYFSFGSSIYLGDINIPDEVVYGSRALKLTRIGMAAFDNCKDMRSVTIPPTVTTISAQAFNGCSSLTSVSIPSPVTSIGGLAFRNCTGLTSVYIAGTVTSIGGQAFAGCSALTEVISRMENPCGIDVSCFDTGVFNNATLYVPQGKASAYKSKDYWRLFKTIDDGHLCATPTIGYANKELKFTCDTQGVTYFYEIKNADTKEGFSHGGSVSLSATYRISVYAAKGDYQNSDIASATLLWTSGIITGGSSVATQANAPTESIPVLISSRDGNLLVTTEMEGQPVSVYSIDGKALGSARVKGGQAVIATHQPKGWVVIVKVGDRSVKVAI